MKIRNTGICWIVINGMPPLWLVKLYREQGGEIITAGADAHIASQVDSTAKITMKFLKEAGFDYFTVYKNHKPEFVKIP